MSLNLFTGRLAHKGCPGYSGKGAVNVTRGIGASYAHAFAPSKELQAGMDKRKRSSKGDEDKLVEAWEWFSPLYIAEMRWSYREHHVQWLHLLARTDEVVLLCYCRTHFRCHRRLLAELLVKCGASYFGEVPEVETAEATR